MSILKCTECNKEFNTRFINASKSYGFSGIVWGNKLKVYPMWPFQTSLNAQCPNCNKENELLVVASKKTKIVIIIIISIIIILLFGIYLI